MDHVTVVRKEVVQKNVAVSKMLSVIAIAVTMTLVVAMYMTTDQAAVVVSKPGSDCDAQDRLAGDNVFVNLYDAGTANSNYYNKGKRTCQISGVTPSAAAKQTCDYLADSGDLTINGVDFTDGNACTGVSGGTLGCITIEMFADIYGSADTCTCSGCGDCLDYSGDLQTDASFVYQASDSDLSVDANSNGIPDGIDGCLGTCEYNIDLYGQCTDASLNADTCGEWETVLSSRGCRCDGSETCPECSYSPASAYGVWKGGKCDYSSLFTTGTCTAQIGSTGLTCDTALANSNGYGSCVGTADNSIATLYSGHDCSGCSNCCHRWENGQIVEQNAYC